MLRFFPKFLIVGTVGFIVDAGVLKGILIMGGDPILARAISLPIALCVTFVFNKFFAFENETKDNITKQFAQYIGVSFVGITVNFTVYSGLTYFFEILPLISLTIASIVAMGVNFLGYNQIFKKSD